MVSEGGTVVCTLTGHGLKDPERAVAGKDLPEAINPDADELRERMGLK